MLLQGGAVIARSFALPAGRAILDERHWPCLGSSRLPLREELAAGRRVGDGQRTTRPRACPVPSCPHPLPHPYFPDFSSGTRGNL